MQFTRDGMKKIIKDWRDSDVATWMNRDKFQEYRRSSFQKRRDIRRSSFSVHMQYLSGCKFLLRKHIALPILLPSLSSSYRSNDLHPVEDTTESHLLVHNPGILHQLTQEWENEKRCDWYQQAVRDSQPGDEMRLSQQIHSVQRQLQQAAALLSGIQTHTVNFKDLSEEQKKMVRDYDTKEGL